MRNILNRIVQQGDLFITKGGVRMLHLSLPATISREGLEEWHWFLLRPVAITLEAAGAPRGIGYRVAAVEVLGQSADLTLLPNTPWNGRLDQSRLDEQAHGLGVTAIHFRFPGVDITLAMGPDARFRRTQKRLAA